jgi:hypothetical protein
MGRLRQAHALRWRLTGLEGVPSNARTLTVSCVAYGSVFEARTQPKGPMKMFERHDMRKWTDWTIAVLLVLSLLGFGIVLFADDVVDEYGFPPAEMTPPPGAAPGPSGPGD